MRSFDFDRKKRLIFIYFAIICGFVAIITRLLFIIIFSDPLDLGNIYGDNKSTLRSNIVDRNGVILATDLDVKLLYAKSSLIRDPKYVAKKLADNFSDLSYKKLLNKISKSKSKDWILIKRNITPKQEQIINNLGIAGLIFENSKTRLYPQKSLLSHVLGYVDLDRNGIAGIEKQYDDFLKQGGEDLQLAIDVRVQDALNNELKKAIKKFKALNAFGIIVDATNGEVLSLVSLPNFDPNMRYNAKNNEKFNRASYGVYELGSVFKIFNHALAIDKKLIDLTEKYSVKEPIKYGKFTIDDDHKEKDILTAEEVFTESSNIGSVKIAQKFGIEKQKEFFKSLGLLDKIDLDFPSLGKPILPKKWGEIAMATISFGHGIAVSPLHVAHGVAGIVNKGKMPPLSMKKIENIANISFKQVVSKDTSKTIRDLLHKTVLYGTGKNAFIKGYNLGGKTGTAERAEFGGYSKKKTLASFVGVFPVEQPKYVIFLGIDQPNYIFNTGGMVAAPVFGQIVKNIAPILGEGNI